MIILIDDDPISIYLCEQQIKRISPNTKIICYNSSVGALKDLINNKDNWSGVVFTDLNMVDISGIDLAVELNKYDHNYDVVIMSATFLDYHIKECSDLGLKCFTKPVNWKFVFSCIS